MAQVQDRPHGERREGHALQEAERAGQFAEGELEHEGCREDQRDGVEPEGVEGEGTARGQDGHCGAPQNESDSLSVA